MQYRTLGNSTLQGSVVAYGAWAIGGSAWWGATDDEEAIRALHAGIDHGITLIDTAPVYGWGHSETVVGQALQGHRDQVVLATKVGLWWDNECGSLFFTHPEGTKVYRCLRPENIRIEVERSLQRMQTDYIDLYQTHWQAMDPEKTPIADTMACLLDLQAQGKIRAIGVSNASPAQMDEYLALGSIATNQPRYSMLDRGIEAELVPYCIEHNISILAYSPLEQGLLTGKIGMDRVFAKGEIRSMQAWMRPANRERVLKMLAGWADLTAKYACTLAQLVIAWTVAQPGITVALCGARTVAQAQENAAAGDLNIDPADLTRMRADVEALGGAVKD